MAGFACPIEHDVGDNGNNGARGGSRIPGSSHESRRESLVPRAILPRVNYDHLIRELEERLVSVNRAIAALSGGAGPRRGRRSAAWRRKISQGMKKRWASGKAAAWRRRISAGMKRRWAARKRSAAKAKA